MFMERHQFDQFRNKIEVFFENEFHRNYSFSTQHLFGVKIVKLIRIIHVESFVMKLDILKNIRLLVIVKSLPNFGSTLSLNFAEKNGLTKLVVRL